jgi:hypothetical protein
MVSYKVGVKFIVRKFIIVFMFLLVNKGCRLIGPNTVSAFSHLATKIPRRVLKT